MQQIPNIRTLKNILILRGEGSLGDAIFSSCCYREIKKANPHIKITVACFGAGYLFLKNNPYIDQIIRLPVRTRIRPNQRWLSLLAAGLKLRRRHFDLVLDSSTKKYVNWRLFKWLAGGERVLDCYTSPVQPFGSLNQHASQHEQAILQLLGIPSPNAAYDLPIPPASRQRVDAYLSGQSIGSYILLNPSGSTERRCFSAQTLEKLCNVLAPLGLPVVVPAAPAYYPHWQTVFADIPHTHVVQTQDIFDLFELVRRARLVVTPDTSVVHIASGFEKPSLVFYNELSPYIAPNNPKACIVQTQRENVNLIDWANVTAALEKIKTWL